MVNESITQRIPWEPKKLSSEVGAPQLRESTLIEKLTRTHTSCPREVVARGGHPLGLIEYMIERVFQFFCHLNYINLTFFLNQPQRVPTTHFLQLTGF